MREEKRQRVLRQMGDLRNLIEFGCHPEPPAGGDGAAERSWQKGFRAHHLRQQSNQTALLYDQAASVKTDWSYLNQVVGNWSCPFSLPTK
jgi:hypothetical protein